jgi:hypothetical protein
VIMASILFGGGLTLAIGMLSGGELGGDGVWTGEEGEEVPTGDDGGSREKSKGPECTGVSLYAVVLIKGGVVKPPERGVTRISPSDTRPGGENSAGTLPKFKK